MRGVTWIYSGVELINFLLLLNADLCVHVFISALLVEFDRDYEQAEAIFPARSLQWYNLWPV